LAGTVFSAASPGRIRTRIGHHASDSAHASDAAHAAHDGFIGTTIYARLSAHQHHCGPARATQRHRIAPGANTGATRTGPAAYHIRATRPSAGVNLVADPSALLGRSPAACSQEGGKQDEGCFLQRNSTRKAETWALVGYGVHAHGLSLRKS
jgi:hypothetical protein